MKAQNRNNLMVANFVSANNWHKKSKKHKLTLTTFFNDLENRGPDSFKSDQLFRKWIKKIRQDMKKSKTWIREEVGEKENIAFVQEYVSRLQAEFWKQNMKYLKSHDVRDRISYWDYHENKIRHLSLYKYAYLKIRVFGLRTKAFCLLNSTINHYMSYRRTVVITHISRYAFGIEYVEDWRATHLAEHYNHKSEFHYCRPFNLGYLFNRV